MSASEKKYMLKNMMPIESQYSSDVSVQIALMYLNNFQSHCSANEKN